MGNDTDPGARGASDLSDHADRAVHADQTDDGRAAAPGAEAGASPEEAPWECLATWSEAERTVWWLGPFAGGTPGLIRRVRRILDVSQRGLAALLGVSQSVVARWETGRTSPRVSVVERLLELAGLEVRLRDRASRRPVHPMRADGARTRGGNRHPAHCDIRATDWWVPAGLRTGTSAEAWRWRRRSREAGDPQVRHRTSPFWKRVERFLHGTPDDHPALHQLEAEVHHLDEWRAQRLRRDELRRDELLRTGPEQDAARREGPAGGPGA